MNRSLQKIRTIVQAVSQKLLWAYTAMLLALVYFIFVGVMSVIVKLLRKDLLFKKNDSRQASYWQARVTSEQTIDRQKHQF
jgi:hypothetical protein